MLNVSSFVLFGKTLGHNALISKFIWYRQPFKSICGFRTMCYLNIPLVQLYHEIPHSALVVPLLFACFKLQFCFLYSQFSESWTVFSSEAFLPAATALDMCLWLGCSGLSHTCTTFPVFWLPAEQL